MARGLTKVADAYARGSEAIKRAALDTWSRALAKTSGLPSLGGFTKDTSEACWGRVASLYADEFAAMGLIVQDLAAQLNGSSMPSFREWMGQPRARLADMEANYHQELAGMLTADAVAGLCLPEPAAAAPPTVVVDGKIASGIRASEPVITGSWAHALLENTTDGPLVVVGAGVEFHGSGGKVLRGVMTGLAYQELAAHQIAGFEFFRAEGAPKGWKSAAVTLFRVEPGTMLSTPLEPGAPSLLPSSLGLLVVGSITNRSTEAWCAGADATVAARGRAVAGGQEDDWRCPGPGGAWTTLIRVRGTAEPDSTVILGVSGTKRADP